MTPKPFRNDLRIYLKINWKPNFLENMKTSIFACIYSSWGMSTIPRIIHFRSQKPSKNRPQRRTPKTTSPNRFFKEKYSNSCPRMTPRDPHDPPKTCPKPSCEHLGTQGTSLGPLGTPKTWKSDPQTSQKLLKPSFLVPFWIESARIFVKTMPIESQRKTLLKKLR